MLDIEEDDIKGIVSYPCAPGEYPDLFMPECNLCIPSNEDDNIGLTISELEHDNLNIVVDNQII